MHELNDDSKVYLHIASPITNAWSERAASRVKLIKIRLRSRMTNKMRGSLINTSSNGPETSASECDSLMKKNNAKWLSSKHYKLSKGKSMTAQSEAGKTSEPAVECMNMSTQTHLVVDIEEISQEEVEQQEEQAIMKLGLAQYDCGCDESDGHSAMEKSDFSDSD